MSLRWRFGLILLVVSLLSAGLVGAIAYQQLQARFTERMLRQAMGNFIADASAYYRTYGSWQTALASERFHDFITRRKATAPATEDEDPVALAPLSGRDGATMGGFGPLQGGGRSFPFRFVLVDNDYKVINGGGRFHVGETVIPAEIGPTLPVLVQGRRVGLAVLQGEIHYSTADLHYLEAMRRGLLIGGGAAVGLSLLIGLLLGEAMRRPLQRLTQAVQAVSDGDLLQRVMVKGGGEIEILASSFNRMGDRLHEQREELAASRRVIEEQVESLRALSLTDPLTQLHNRRSFDQQARQLFDQASRYGQPFAVMLGDIDHFKRINDSCSHSTGDAVLRRIGAILRQGVRSSDVVARYGGEEFVIAFPQTALPEALRLCERLRLDIAEAGWSDLGADLTVTISIGLSGDRAAGSLEAMLKQADELLYQAKRQGRNQVCVVPERSLNNRVD